MARRGSLRSTAAKSMTKLKGHGYDRQVKESLRQIDQQAFDEREERSDARYAAAGQFISAMDKMSAAKEQDVKAEKGVSAMQEYSGEEVKYTKATLGGWLKGENKFRDIGKESFIFGDKEFSKADMIAYDKTYQKNKWEDVLFDQSAAEKGYEKAGEATTDVEKAMKPWTYESQKASDKEARAVARKQKAFEDKPWETDSDRFKSPAQQRASLKKMRKAEKATQKQEKADLKEQGLSLSKKKGSGWDKFKSGFAQMFGGDEDIEEMDKGRKDTGISDIDDDDSDVVPISVDDLVTEYTEGSDEEFDKAVDLTEGAGVPTLAQTDIDSDITQTGKNLVTSPGIASEDEAIAQGQKKDYWGEHKGPDFMKGKSAKEYFGGLFGGGKDETQSQEEEANTFGEQQEGALKKMLGDTVDDETQVVTTDITPDEIKTDVQGDKTIDRSLDVIEEDAKFSVAEGYVKEGKKFDKNVTDSSAGGFKVSMSSRTREDDGSGFTMFSLYEGDKMIMEDAFKVELDPTTGMNTRNISDLNPMLKGWGHMQSLTSNIGEGQAALKKRLTNEANTAAGLGPKPGDKSDPRNIDQSDQPDNTKEGMIKDWTSQIKQLDRNMQQYMHYGKNELKEMGMSYTDYRATEKRMQEHKSRLQNLIGQYK